MTESLGDLRKRASLPNALHGCTSDPCGSVVCQTARDRDTALFLIEQAEQALEATERQVAARSGETAAERIWRGRAEQAEQAVQRVRAKHAERVLVYPNGAEEHYCAAEENSAWPCDTIRALDGEQA